MTVFGLFILYFNYLAWSDPGQYKFYRSECELTHETVDTGIGLALVSQMTLAMNGRIDVVYELPGAEIRLVL